MKKSQFILLIFLAFAFLSWIGIDNGVYKHPVLKQIVDKVDKSGIDVCSDWNAIENKNFARTTLAPLRDYPVDLNIKTTRYSTIDELKNAWQQQFRSGVRRYLVAESGPKSTKKSPGGRLEELNKRWEKATGKRIFISYARENSKDASAIANAFTEQGFEAFTYLNSKGEIQLSPEVAGAYFSSADYVFVVDTKEARSKVGVKLEFELLKEIEKIRQERTKDFEVKIEKLKKELIREKVESRVKQVQQIERQIRRLESERLRFEKRQFKIR